MTSEERAKPLEKSRFPDSTSFHGRPVGRTSISLAGTGRTFSRVQSKEGANDTLDSGFAHVTSSQAWATASAFDFLAAEQNNKNDYTSNASKSQNLQKGRWRARLFERFGGRSGVSSPRGSAADDAHFTVEFNSLYHPDRLQTEVASILSKQKRRHTSDEKKKRIKCVISLRRQYQTGFLLITFHEESEFTVIRIELIKPRKDTGREAFVEFYKSLMLEMRHLGPEALVPKD